MLATSSAARYAASHMNRLMIYPTREQEYQLAGWVGALELMSRAGEIVTGNEGYTQSLESKNLSSFALRLCVHLYQKPNETYSFIEKWLDKRPSEAQGQMRREALFIMGIAFPGASNHTSISETFSDALALRVDPEVQGYADKYTDFSRLGEEISLATDFCSPAVTRMVQGDCYAYREARREIDFSVGFHDPLKH